MFARLQHRFLIASDQKLMFFCLTQWLGFEDDQNTLLICQKGRFCCGAKPAHIP